MWTWVSIQPGITVSPLRSTVGFCLALAMLVMRPASMTISWFFRTRPLPSIKAPVLITVGCAMASAARKGRAKHLRSMRFLVEPAYRVPEARRIETHMSTFHRLIAALVLLAFCSGCSIKKLAVNKLGNMLASSGSNFESDEDPELVAAAIPFGLKLYEGLLAESPKHTGLLLAAESGFTEYSYAFVDLKAEEAKEQSLDQADALRERARKLYLRANRYGMRGLEARYPVFGAALDNDAVSALKRVRKADVPLLYWTAASLGLAVSSSKGSPEMIAQLPLVEMIVNRIAELDETFDNGAVPEFLITLEAARSGVKLEDQEKAMRQHFDRAIEISKGKRAGTYVSFAENASVPAQNAAEFKSLLEKALAVDVDADPDTRLANVIAQRRARWLLAHQSELFLEQH